MKLVGKWVGQGLGSPPFVFVVVISGVEYVKYESIGVLLGVGSDALDLVDLLGPLGLVLDLLAELEAEDTTLLPLNVEELLRGDQENPFLFLIALIDLGDDA